MEAPVALLSALEEKSIPFPLVPMTRLPVLTVASPVKLGLAMGDLRAKAVLVALATHLAL